MQLTTADITIMNRNILLLFAIFFTVCITFVNGVNPQNPPAPPVVNPAPPTLPAFALDKFVKSFEQADKFTGLGDDVASKFGTFLEMVELQCAGFAGLATVFAVTIATATSAIPSSVSTVHDAALYSVVLFLTSKAARQHVRNSVMKDSSGQKVLSGIRALTKLKNLFYSKTIGNVTAVQDKIKSVKFPDRKDPSSIIAVMSTFFTELSELDAAMTEYTKISYIISALPDTYHGLRNSLSDRTDLKDLSAAEMFDMVLNHWQNIVSKMSGSGDHHGLHSMSYQQNTGKGNKGKGRFSHRGRGDSSNYRNGYHSLGVNNDWRKNQKGKGKGGKGKGKGKGGKGNKQCNKCKRFGHYANECQTKACPVCGSFEHSPWNCDKSNFQANGNSYGNGNGNGNAVTQVDNDKKADGNASNVCQACPDTGATQNSVRREQIKKDIAEMQTTVDAMRDSDDIDAAEIEELQAELDRIRNNDDGSDGYVSAEDMDIDSGADINFM